MKKMWQVPSMTVHGDVADLTLGCIVVKEQGGSDDLADLKTVPEEGGVIVPDCPTS